MAAGWYASWRDTCLVLLQALPASLRVLHASTAPAELLARLTVLESLTLDDTISQVAAATCSFSALQRLTMLQLGRAHDAELDMIRACTGLRTLYFGSESSALCSIQPEHAALQYPAWSIACTYECTIVMR